MLTLSLYPNDVSLSGNPIIFKVLSEETVGTPYTNLTVPAQHALEIDILIEAMFGTDDFILLGTVVSRVSDDTYSFVVDVSATIHAWFQDYLKSQTLPVQSGHAFNPNILRQIKIVFREKEGITLLDTLNTNAYYTHFGVAEIGTDFLPIENSKTWLTSLPSRRFVNLEKPVYLSWINNTTGLLSAAWIPQYKLYSRDNALIGVFTKAAVTVLPGQTVTFNVGGLDFGVDYPLSIVGKMVFDFVENGSIIYAPPITFYNDLIEQPNERILLYRNRLGAIESLRCTGELTKEKEVARYESVTVGDYTNQAHYYGHRSQYDADVTTIYTFRTGYISKAEKEAYADMFVTNDVWFLSNGKYIPLRLLDNKFEELDTFEELSSVVMRCALKNVEK